MKISKCNLQNVQQNVEWHTQVFSFYNFSQCIVSVEVVPNTNHISKSNQKHINTLKIHIVDKHAIDLFKRTKKKLFQLFVLCS